MWMTVGIVRYWRNRAYVTVSELYGSGRKVKDYHDDQQGRQVQTGTTRSWEKRSWSGAMIPTS